MRPIRLVEWFQRLTDWVTGKKKPAEAVVKEPVVKKGRGRPKSTKKTK